MQDIVPVCGVCQNSIFEAITPEPAGKEVGKCPACQTPHHRACWEQNKGCSLNHCSIFPKPGQAFPSTNLIELHSVPYLEDAIQETYKMGVIDQLYEPPILIKVHPPLKSSATPAHPSAEPLLPPIRLAGDVIAPRRNRAFRFVLPSIIIVIIGLFVIIQNTRSKAPILPSSTNIPEAVIVPPTNHSPVVTSIIEISEPKTQAPQMATKSDADQSTISSHSLPGELTSEKPKYEWIAYSFGKQGKQDIILRNISDGEFTLLTSGNNWDQSPTLSPDGRFLAYTSCRGDCEIYIIDMQTRSERRLTSLNVQAKWPDWCQDPSNPWIVFEGLPDKYTHQIWRVNIETGEAKVLTANGSDTRPAWLPDCTKIVFGRAKADSNRDGAITANDFQDMYILDLTSKDISPVFTTPDDDDFNFAWSPNNDWIAFTRVSTDSGTPFTKQRGSQ
jgi:Tol biopolymer transport system component